MSTTKVRIAVYLSKELHEKLEDAKQRYQISQSAIIAMALANYLRNSAINGKKTAATPTPTPNAEKL